MVTALAMTRTYEYFLEDEQYGGIFKKFLVEKTEEQRLMYQTSAEAA